MATGSAPGLEGVLTPTTRVAPPDPGHRGAPPTRVTRERRQLHPRERRPAEWYGNLPTVTRLRSGGWGFESLAARHLTAAQRPCDRVADRCLGGGLRPNCDHVGGHSQPDCDHLRPQSPLLSPLLLVTAGMGGDPLARRRGAGRHTYLGDLGGLWLAPGWLHDDAHPEHPRSPRGARWRPSRPSRSRAVGADTSRRPYAYGVRTPGCSG
jgi:hypothetical protein